MIDSPSLTQQSSFNNRTRNISILLCSTHLPITLDYSRIHRPKTRLVNNTLCIKHILIFLGSICAEDLQQLFDYQSVGDQRERRGELIGGQSPTKAPSPREGVWGWGNVDVFGSWFMDLPVHKRRSPGSFLTRGFRRTAATYSPTWWGSTIGVGELNFSVRNGKRWFLTAITTAIYYLREQIARRLPARTR